MRTVSVLVVLVVLGACGGTAASSGPVADGGGGGGGSGSGSCTAGLVTFAVQASGAFCTAKCSPSMLTISDSSGKDVRLDVGCTTSCSACLPENCPAICPASTKVSTASPAWDGTFYEGDTCGSSITCLDRECAAPGHYTAHLCLYADQSDAGVASSCSPSDTPTCVDVPFDWPTTATLSASLGP